MYCIICIRVCTVVRLCVPVDERTKYCTHNTCAVKYVKRSRNQCFSNWDTRAICGTVTQNCGTWPLFLRGSCDSKMLRK